MLLSVIIVNYHSESDIIRCLRSTSQYESFEKIQWIIVENDSDAAGKELIMLEFPNVKWIDMGYNAGFARANNEGIRQSAGEIVLLLNPDTIILDDAIYKCFQKFVMSNYVACSVQLLNPDYTPQITGNFVITGALNHLLPLPYLGKLLRSIAFSINVKTSNVTKSASEEKVDWINGAFLMVKKEKIKTAGLMDEDFFLYSEETEWCSRLKKEGELCVFGNLSVIHIQGETINKATGNFEKGYFNLYDRKGLQIIVSHMVRIRKELGIGWFLVHLMIYSFDLPVFLICSILENIFRLRNPFSEWKLIKGFAYNLLITWRLFFTILSNRPFFYKMI
ncbi:glycosyltransferase [Foetidibacter luteolus]|uniref:glycosyltransferase n=1 Tax=Foetidibacter luteolus TaxID=2608880 RepID=UPI00129A7465|nr:glycosyltransferase [Foetidibacter luteolus]